MTGADGSVSLEPAGQFELSGAPLDNLHQTCAETGRHLEQVKAVGDKLGLGFLGLGMWPDKTRAELPRHAQGALRDHAAAHAARRQHRARHDAPHLHDPGQPRLCVRSRHGEEVPRRPGAAAARDRAVRQFAVHRGQAQRHAVVPQPYLVGHRPAPHRHAAVRVRGRLRLRALCRLCARCADVLRLPRRPLSSTPRG